jgi:hypothetical protein
MENYIIIFKHLLMESHKKIKIAKMKIKIIKMKITKMKIIAKNQIN